MLATIYRIKKRIVSMDYLSLLLLVSLLWISIHLLISNLGIKFTSKYRKLQLPPGPRPYPIIGNILELGTNPHKALAKLSQTYGPIMSLKFGAITTIVISSPQLAKDILSKYDQNFSHRKVVDAVRAMDHHKYSVAWLPSNLAEFRTLRRVCATKVFSSQKLDSTQAFRQRKVQELLNYVEEKCKKGEAMDIGETIFTTLLNSMSSTLFSMDFGDYYNSPKSQEFKDTIVGIFEEVGRPNVTDFFPIFRLFDPQGIRTKSNKYFGKLITFIDGIVEERLQSRASSKSEPKAACEDALDFVLEFMSEENTQVITRTHLLHLFLDLFVAGVDTTSSTIEWAMVELLRNPKELEKVREELRQVIGKGKQQIEESHISKLPFLRAVVKETLRMHPPAPFLVPHKSETEVELCGFMVPKNAQILVNVWAMGRDSSIWTNPDEFMPERFLNIEIDFKGQDFELIPFGAGRRICPGLPLAYRSMHTVLATLLSCYDWKLIDGLKGEDVDMSEEFGLTLHRKEPLLVVPIVESLEGRGKI